MNVVLLQLPVQSHDYTYPRENMALGVGYLKAYAESVLPEVRIVLGPKALVNYGGDQALVDWILSQNPDVVGFSCYVWNVERSLALARRLRARSPHVRIVLGGPEVTPENDFLTKAGGFDVGVLGEGEETFVAVLASLSRCDLPLENLPGLLLPCPEGWRVTKPRPPIKKLDSIPSPYLCGALYPSDAGTILLETVRGCPNRCTYCYYHKRFPQVRPFSLRRLQEELLWAAHQGVSEIYFVDPCFTRRKDFDALLEAIQKARHLHAFTFQCEGNAEDISPALADALAQAGLTQMEVGLQTINPKALARIRRPFNRKRFVDGVRALRLAGIQVMVDIMLALPEDSLDDVKKTIDFVVDQDLYDELSVYTLSLLPGTELRRQAENLGIVYHPAPPYHVLQTPHMSPTDIRRAYEYAEEATGVDFFPPDLPPFLDPPEIHRHGPYITAFPVEKTQELFLRSHPVPHNPVQDPFGLVGQALTVYVSRHTAHFLEESSIKRIFAEIFEKNPWSLLSLMISVDTSNFPWAAVFSLAYQVLNVRNHVMDREDFSTLDPVKSVQIFALLPVRASQRTLVRFPVVAPSVIEGHLAATAPTADQAWVAVPENMSREEETLWLEAIWPWCPPHIQRMRLGDAATGS
ncbi:MAG: radical SAM protein [Desulfosoma sp.]